MFNRGDGSFYSKARNLHDLKIKAAFQNTPRRVTMTFSSLSLTCDATVESTWRDDGYPSYETDYLTLYIKIPGWTDPVLSKLYNKEGDPSPADNGSFNFSGEYFLNPGKEWTSTYFLIRKYSKIADEVLEPAIPTFHLSRAQVRQNLQRLSKCRGPFLMSMKPRDTVRRSVSFLIKEPRV